VGSTHKKPCIPHDRSDYSGTWKNGKTTENWEKI